MRRTRGHLKGYLGALLMFCGARAVAVNALPDSLPPRSYLLPTVRVVADSPQEAMATVKRLEPASREAAISLYEGLQKVPGISNTVGTKDESSLRLRGFRKNELKLMVNGRPLSGGYFGNVDIGNFSLDGVEELQIISGPAAAVYGANTMGGVVNLIRQDPSNDAWATLSLTARRNNTNRFSLSSAHRFKTWSYRLSASREHSEGLPLSASFTPTVFENGGIRDSQFKTLWNLDGELYFDLSPWQKAGLSAGWGHIPQKRLPSSVYEASYRQYLDWRRAHATLMWEGVLGQDLSGAAMLWYDGGGDRYQQFNDPGFHNISMDSEMRHHSLGLAPRFKLQTWKGSNLQFGLNALFTGSERKDNGFYLDWDNHFLGQHNAWLQWQIQLARLGITAGSVFSAWHHDPRDGLQGFADPGMGISWKHNSLAASRLSVGLNSSYPTMRQLFSVDRGNPLLKPQRALKTELSHSLSLQTGRVRSLLEASLFYNAARDIIELQAGRYENIYRVDSWGAELNLLTKPLPDWEFSFGYALLKYRSDSDYRLTESAPQSAVIDLILPLVYSVKLKLNSGWTDIRFSQDSFGGYHLLPSYWKHDLSLSRQWKRTRLSLGLENLLDANYFTEYGYPAPGRDFFVKLSQSF